MWTSFFTTAMVSPGRQRSFRRLAVFHAGLLAALALLAYQAQGQALTLLAVANLILILGIVEGATLIGWRLTQLPKSQALEFLLVSPLHPSNVFLAECLVGIARFALVQLAGWPLLLVMVITQTIAPQDLLPIALLPFLWGVCAGLALTVWAYEPRGVRRVGEFIAIAGILVYLVLGILAGENLRLWLDRLPSAWADAIYASVRFVHEYNPFGVVREWFVHGRVSEEVWRRFQAVNAMALVLNTLLALRAASRLKGHFHDRHYRPISSDRAAQTESIGQRPLTWWAVRRVMEYSGRVNVWLAGGFSLLYAAYTLAQDHWPPWMGRIVFQIFDSWGGIPAVATALAVMATVPAVFQFGLWDPTITDRCRRLELLLLTELSTLDYWLASLAAAWRRGREYLVLALLLTYVLPLAGQASFTQALAATVGIITLWAFSFALGFRTFSTGYQASGIASLMTLGLPFLLVLMLRQGMNSLAAFLPPALPYLPLAVGITWPWVVSVIILATLTLWLTAQSNAHADSELRRWYDANQGRMTVE